MTSAALTERGFFNVIFMMIIDNTNRCSFTIANLRQGGCVYLMPKPDSSVAQNLELEVCICDHDRDLHIGSDNRGPCTEEKCNCIRFQPKRRMTRRIS